jgi:glucuronyl esterase-like protein
VGALRAWAWGASRALDYFETDKSVDARQVGIGGLSRYGKAALVAMAYEPRLAIAFVGSSGAGGAKLSRRTFGEQVENVASSAEYHWMAGNFLKYAGPLTANDLPVDAHELIALCAPRPVFISGGTPELEGGWVDVKGTFLAAVNAGPVYRLLGKRDLGATEFPPIETPLIDGDQRVRPSPASRTSPSTPRRQQNPSASTDMTLAPSKAATRKTPPGCATISGHPRPFFSGSTEHSGRVHAVVEWRPAQWASQHAEDRSRRQVAAQPARPRCHAGRDDGIPRHWQALLFTVYRQRPAEITIMLAQTHARSSIFALRPQFHSGGECRRSQLTIVYKTMAYVRLLNHKISG